MHLSSIGKLAYFFVASLVFVPDVFSQNWIPKGSQIEGENQDDHSGIVDLSADGNTMAIGASDNDGNGQSSGHVRVFSYIDNDWVQKGKDIDGESSFDRSGGSVSLSADGNTLAIGAASNSSSASQSGHVRVFTWTGTFWEQRGNDIDGESENDFFGASISLSEDGNTLAAGSPYNEDVAWRAGHVRVFFWNGSSWKQKGQNIEGQSMNDRFSIVNISKDGNNLIIGAAQDVQKYAGYASVFYWVDSTWQQKGDKLIGEKSGDLFGTAVGINRDGSSVIVGARLNDKNGRDAGHLKVFIWNGQEWEQKGQTIYGEETGDNFGFSVAMSSSGEIIASGAIYDNESVDFTGNVRVFEWADSLWVQKGTNIDGNPNSHHFGQTLSMSANGASIAAGAQRNASGGFDAGHVWVYEFGWLSGITKPQVSESWIYPNPSRTKFNFKPKDASAAVDLEVFDSKGLEITHNGHIEDNIFVIEIEGNPGIYFVVLKIEGQIAGNYRVIKF